MLIKLIITFVIIFICVLIFMFLWAKAIEQFLLFQKRIKPESLAWTISIGGIAASTTLSIAILYFIINFLLGVPDLVGEKITTQQQLFNLDKSDCQTLTSFIYRSQNTLANLEDHRSIEANAPLFTINLEYQKGLEQMRKEATKYTSLEVRKDTKAYTEKIAGLLDQKADYFQDRINVDLNQTDVQGVFNLLDKLDSVTEQRTELINQINQQCR
jgi:hypothetical protein